MNLANSNNKEIKANRAFTSLKKIIFSEGLEEVLNLELQVVKVLANMEYTGMEFDSEKWLNLSKKAEINTFKYEKELDSMASEISELDKYLENTAVF